MSQKYALSWHDYRETVSKSFATFKNEEYLHDVTLVSDDNIHFLAHKFVLSTCSEFFRNILKRCKGQNPFLCLEGVKAEEIQNIIDYFYSGEVELIHDKVERFLAIAKRLQIEGLSNYDHEYINIGQNGQKYLVRDEKKHSQVEEFVEENNLIYNDSVNVQASTPSPEETKKSCKIARNCKKNYKASSQTNNEDFEAAKKILIEVSETEGINETINSFLSKNEDGSFRCILCNKTGKWKQNIQSHIETHLVGRVVPCTICRKTFSTSATLRSHLKKHKNHRKFKYGDTIPHSKYYFQEQSEDPQSQAS